MAITPEACVPENVERLIAALKEAEFALGQERRAHANTKTEVRKALNPDYITIYEDPVHNALATPWTDTLELIARAAKLMRSPSANAEDLAMLRRCEESATRCAEIYRKRSDAYKAVVYALRDMAKRADPMVIRFSGEDLMLVIRQLDNNPDL